MPNTALDIYAHPDAGRYDNDHGDSGLIDDDSQAERAAEYRDLIPHDNEEALNLAQEMVDDKVLRNLIGIYACERDSAYIGALFCQALDDLLDRRSQLLSENDSGELIELQGSRDMQYYEFQFEEARTAIRKRGI